MFASRISRPADLAALERIEALVRDRYCVDAHDIVLVSEEAGRDPGLPVQMTTILFWAGPETRHRLRVFKPACDVAATDLPPSWIKGALLDEGEGDCC